MMTKIENFLQQCSSRINKSDDTVFLIGGGPSVKELLPDINILRGKNIITTNNAYQLFPDAIAHHFGDRVWTEWHRDKITDKFCTVSNVERPYWENSCVTCFYAPDSAIAIAEHKDYLSGNNAGHHVINLAYHLGFKRMILIGYDLHPVKNCHWHNDHQRPTNLGNFEDVMIPAFKRIVPLQEKLGFVVLNANRQSNLKCFEFCDLVDYLK